MLLNFCGPSPCKPSGFSWNSTYWITRLEDPIFSHSQFTSWDVGELPQLVLNLLSSTTTSNPPMFWRENHWKIERLRNPRPESISKIIPKYSPDFFGCWNHHFRWKSAWQGPDAWGWTPSSLTAVTLGKKMYSMINQPSMPRDAHYRYIRICIDMIT